MEFYQICIFLVTIKKIFPQNAANAKSGREMVMENQEMVREKYCVKFVGTLTLLKGPLCTWKTWGGGGNPNVRIFAHFFEMFLVIPLILPNPMRKCCFQIHVGGGVPRFFSDGFSKIRKLKNGGVVVR